MGQHSLLLKGCVNADQAETSQAKPCWSGSPQIGMPGWFGLPQLSSVWKGAHVKGYKITGYAAVYFIAILCFTNSSFVLIIS